jgi:hypothetical protein
MQLRRDIADRSHVELVAAGQLLQHGGKLKRSRPSIASAQASSRSMISTGAELARDEHELQGKLASSAASARQAGQIADRDHGCREL